MNLNIELVSGDINEVGELDFLLLGHNNPLLEQITRETHTSFKSIDSASWMFPHQYQLLDAPGYKWKQVAAIKFRANGKIRETQFARISSPITTALKQPQVKLIGILPPTWRNPSYCALGVIYSLWIIGYASASSTRLMRELFFPNPSSATFKIISQTGTEYFEDVLKEDCQVMWEFVNELCQKRKDDPLFCSYKNLKKHRVTFNVSQVSM